MPIQHAMKRMVLPALAGAIALGGAACTVEDDDTDVIEQQTTESGDFDVIQPTQIETGAGEETGTEVVTEEPTETGS